ncbi:hypothetical protein KMZ68_18175 [Bradyrhizobium sediminis]|uniref:Uncharacterized protein n=1 Tax=Bradyrhizobium sediminis TaxID=2840469 RepID=A0A975NKM0_9BRAD|nr:hypothetical protein [Bradyrhizobium sediminis]QWG16898.1 hypothetical protein KMZ68_18175 [Bradyrhizobium sediminis]
MNVSAVSVSIPVRAPEAGEPKPPQVKPEDDRAGLPKPTGLAPLPPGQGRRIDQIA